MSYCCWLYSAYSALLIAQQTMLAMLYRAITEDHYHYPTPDQILSSFASTSRQSNILLAPITAHFILLTDFGQGRLLG